MSEDRRDYYDSNGNHIGYSQPYTGGADINPIVLVSVIGTIGTIIATIVGIIDGFLAGFLFLFWYTMIWNCFLVPSALIGWGLGAISNKASKR